MFKIVIDKLISLILLLLLFPFFFFLSLLILIILKRPIFFLHERLGKNEKKFLVIKFKTLYNHTDSKNSIKKRENKFGNILRRYSIDELPQLINILKGDMVFIGPRPALYNQYDLIKLRKKARVHKLVPGITGWAQVNGRDELSIPDKVKMDQYYLNNQSVWLDIKIVFLTSLNVIKSEGVST